MCIPLICVIVENELKRSTNLVMIDPPGAGDYFGIPCCAIAQRHCTCLVKRLWRYGLLTYSITEKLLNYTTKVPIDRPWTLIELSLIRTKVRTICMLAIMNIICSLWMHYKCIKQNSLLYIFDVITTILPWTNVNDSKTEFKCKLITNKYFF